MSSRFKAKELILLLPVLGFVGVAFYWTRVELGGQVRFNGKQIPQGLFVESVKLEVAPGDKREQGFSHMLTVTLDHSEPQPKYWGHCCNVYQFYDAFDKPLPSKKSLLGLAYTNYLAALGKTIRKSNGKSVVLGHKRTSLGYGHLDHQDGKLILIRNLALQNVGQQGTIEFNDTYVVGGQDVIDVHQVLRKAGDKLMFDQNRAAGGSLLSATQGGWQDTIINNSPVGSTPAKITQASTTDINLEIKCIPQPITQAPQFNIYDIELVDGLNQLHKLNDFNLIWMIPKVPTEKSASNTYQLSQNITLGSNFRPPQPWILRGKVSIDHHWPLLFSMKLTPVH